MQSTDNKIFTIGHGSRKIEDFVHLLKCNGIAVVIDVRTYPYSRFNPQYRKAQLEIDLKGAGIEYLFLGAELGGRPQNPALYINDKVSYPAIKQTAMFQKGITEVIELAKLGIRATLMCGEADQNNCHRKHLISDELIKRGLEVVHINKYGKIENNLDHTSDLFA